MKRIFFAVVAATIAIAGSEANRFGSLHPQQNPGEPSSRPDELCQSIQCPAGTKINVYRNTQSGREKNALLQCKKGDVVSGPLVVCEWGQVRQRAHYKKGKRSGIQQMWDENGKFSGEVYFENGKAKIHNREAWIHFRAKNLKLELELPPGATAREENNGLSAGIIPFFGISFLPSECDAKEIAHKYCNSRAADGADGSERCVSSKISKVARLPKGSSELKYRIKYEHPNSVTTKFEYQFLFPASKGCLLAYVKEANEVEKEILRSVRLVE